jgi:hypothetical protein
MLSVSDIQGKWGETNSKNVWEVSGIIAEKANVRRGMKKSPIVLSDGPFGVEWGKGNLTGNMEAGILVWRNRRGEATYCWEKLPGASTKVTHTEGKPATCFTSPPLPIAFLPQAPTKTDFQPSADKFSPRSTNSAASIDTTEITAGMGSSVMNVSRKSSVDIVDEHSDDIAASEMHMLVEMARQRLLAGDVYMSMRYITLAQQVQPLAASFGCNE